MHSGYGRGVRSLPTNQEPSDRLRGLLLGAFEKVAPNYTLVKFDAFTLGPLRGFFFWRTEMNALVDHKAFAAATPATPDVSLFDFKGHQIRVVTIGGEPWFVGSDVLNILYGKAGGMGHVYDPLDEKEVQWVKPSHLNLGRGSRRTLLSESGLYKLVLRSDKPEAKPFQDWVTKEVLPAIRKDGGYIMGEEKVRSGEMSEDEFVLRAMEIMQGKIARLTQERDTARATITEHLEYITVDEWRALSHLYLPRGVSSKLGKWCGMLMDQREIPRQKQRRILPNGKEAEVNVWLKSILDEAAEALGLVGFKVVK